MLRFVSYAVQGIHPNIVQEHLGHSSIAITPYPYSHVTARLQEAAAKSFDQAFPISYNGLARESWLAIG